VVVVVAGAVVVLVDGATEVVEPSSAATTVVELVDVRTHSGWSAPPAQLVGPSTATVRTATAAARRRVVGSGPGTGTR